MGGDVCGKDNSRIGRFSLSTLVLIRVQDDHARAFYEIEAVKESWSIRELERQIAALLFERLAKSRHKEEVLALAKQGQTVTMPKDVIKDPFVLEFLELHERSAWHERDLEQATIDRLESFLLKLGKQKSGTIAQGVQFQSYANPMCESNAGNGHYAFYSSYQPIHVYRPADTHH